MTDKNTKLKWNDKLERWEVWEGGRLLSTHSSWSDVEAIYGPEPAE